MTNAKIFLVGNEQSNLIEMVETAYDTEAVLQTLLVDYPSLLPGDQINPNQPRRWLLVKQEMGVPGSEDSGTRWSLDHLFLDQDGVPTFVECKRASDTRIRREVVAQMLDYAANGTVYWKMEQLRQIADQSAAKNNASLDDKVAELLDQNGDADGTDIERFWEQVEANLETGRVRLVFVADVIPTELRRLVEFMNEKMTDVEVLAVEIKQFVAENRQKVLVPRVIGLTESARARKEVRRGASTTIKEWDGHSRFLNTGERQDGSGYSWADYRAYNFVCAGGAPRFRKWMKELEIDDVLYMYLSGHGYVGVGTVTKKAEPYRSATLSDGQRLVDLNLEGTYRADDDDDQCDWIALVEWKYTVNRNNAVVETPISPATICKIYNHWSDLTTRIETELVKRQ